MPVIKSAKKKLRQDKKREFQNEGVRNTLKSCIKTARAEKSEKAVIVAVQVADRAVKKHIIHKNKAARIKSSLAKLLVIKKESKPQKASKTVKTSQASAVA